MYGLRLFRSKDARLAATVRVTAEANRPIREALQSPDGSTEAFAIGSSLRRMRRAESSRSSERKIAAENLIPGKLECLSHGYEQRRFTVRASSVREHQRAGSGTFNRMQESDCLAVAKWFEVRHGHRAQCDL